MHALRTGVHSAGGRLRQTGKYFLVGTVSFVLGAKYVMWAETYLAQNYIVEQAERDCRMAAGE